MTVLGDSLAGQYPRPDGWGGRCHDLLGTRCDPYVNKMLRWVFFGFGFSVSLCFWSGRDFGMLMNSVVGM